ncbi:hypothetical protein QQ045_014306 [Rhodiola kirilowii]
MKRKSTDLQEESSNVDAESSIVRGGGGVPDPNRPQPPEPNNDGANTQFQRRRKVGRPPGSTNNSKSPASITRKPDPVLSPCIIEVADGADVLSSISEFCNNYPETCVSILSATGAVSVVNLYQTGPITSSNLEFNGRFVILSLTATFITPIPATKSQLLPSEPLNVTIIAKGADGQIIGGIVAEPLIASGTVYITVTKFSRPTIVAKFTAPEWRKLPMEENIASWSQGVMWTIELDPQYAD